MLTKNKLIELAAKSGIHRCGVIAPESYAGVEPQFSPLSIFPEAKSIIICARQISRGSFRGIEEGTLWARASRLIPAYYVYDLARSLENLGGVAVPCSPMAQERWPEGVKIRGGSVEPNVYPDLTWAAVAGGIGEIGLCGMLITPEFGVRQQLGMIITDLEFERDIPFTPHLCDGESCGKCAAECPMDAIDMTKLTEHEICGVKFKTAEINALKCRYCPNGMFPDTSGATLPNRMTAACSRACLNHLEETGRTKVRPSSPFRRRESWGFDLESL
ncbi:MAG: hypothetical protein GX628_10415 [Clostridiales bacterium]|nr:hypothetical protein [Clostridiales bacterium]